MFNKLIHFFLKFSSLYSWSFLISIIYEKSVICKGKSLNSSNITFKKSIIKLKSSKNVSKFYVKNANLTRNILYVPAISYAVIY